MKEQVTSGDEEGSPTDETAELLSEVRRSLSFSLISVSFRKAERVLLLLWNLNERANLQYRWMQFSPIYEVAVNPLISVALLVNEGAGDQGR